MLTKINFCHRWCTFLSDGVSINVLATGFKFNLAAISGLISELEAPVSHKAKALIILLGLIADCIITSVISERVIVL
jgi:exosortase/archaeosortase